MSNDAVCVWPSLQDSHSIDRALQQFQEYVNVAQPDEYKLVEAYYNMALLEILRLRQKPKGPRGPDLITQIRRWHDKAVEAESTRLWVFHKVTAEGFDTKFIVQSFMKACNMKNGAADSAVLPADDDDRRRVSCACCQANPLKLRQCSRCRAVFYCTYYSSAYSA